MGKQATKKTPILLINGAHDKKINPQDSLDMTSKFLKYHIPFRYISYENNDHYLSESRNEADGQLLRWFDRFV